MIDYRAPRISDEQAEAVAAAIERLMAIDLAMRSAVPMDPLEPDSVSAAIVRLVLAFSHAHGDLEAMCGGSGGLRAIAEEKRLQLALVDRAN